MSPSPRQRCVRNLVKRTKGALPRFDPLWDERLIIIMIAMAMARLRYAAAADD